MRNINSCTRVKTIMGIHVYRYVYIHAYLREKSMYIHIYMSVYIYMNKHRSWDLYA